RQLQQQCQRYAILDARLPAVLLGMERPAAAEEIEFARLCILKKDFAAAARFSRDAFAAEPKLAEVVPTGNRYVAACAAALAGCGQGKDADTLDDKERALWRAQARQWLRADLGAWDKNLVSGLATDRAKVQETLARWREQTELAGL